MPRICPHAPHPSTFGQRRWPGETRTGTRSDGGLGEVIGRTFATGDIRRQIRPLIEIEEFGAGLQS